MKKRIEKLRGLISKAKLGGGALAIEKQHEKGKLTARERLEVLLDDGSFRELGLFIKSSPLPIGEKKEFLGDGLVAGFGKINGRRVLVYSQDFTVMGGSLGERHAEKIVKIIQTGRKVGVPVIAIQDSGGARIQEGVVSLAGYASIFKENTLSSGVVPQIACILGPCAGGAVYSPGLMDFVFMTKGTSHMFLTGPDVIKTVLHEEVTFEDLGGASVHTQKSGVSHFVSENEVECLKSVRELLNYIPSNNKIHQSRKDSSVKDVQRRENKLRDIIPDSSDKPYDMKEILDLVLDDNSFFEVQSSWAKNIVVGYGRMDGYAVGIIANQPNVLAGCLDSDACNKSARFIRFCDSFNIPVVSFVDVPGFLPGKDQEHQGIIRHGAKLLHAYSECTVPLLTVVTRKAYGGAYCVMAPKQLGADLNLAWPSAEFAVMGAEGAINIIFRKDIKNAKDEDEKRKDLIHDYETNIATPYIAAERGYVDEVVDPIDTRPKLIEALRFFKSKREKMPPRKHGNIPL